MRVAAIYDIHGNLPALEAVLQDIRQAGVNHVVVGGDVILGPMPRETLTCLLDLDIPVQFIQGNCDREVLARMRGTETGTVPEQFREVVRWVAQQLHPEHEQLLARWPKTLRVEIRGLGEVLFAMLHREATLRYLPVLRLKTASYQSLKDSTYLWSSAVIPTCSLTARSEGFEL